MRKRVSQYDLDGWGTPRRVRRWPWLLAALLFVGLVAWFWSGALRAQWRADAPSRFAAASKAVQVRLMPDNGSLCGYP